MTKAVELLRKDFYRKGVCAIADIVKTRQEKTDNKRGIGNRGKTKIVVKEHFSEKGKTMETCGDGMHSPACCKVSFFHGSEFRLDFEK